VILVTGATGTVGFHLLEELTDARADTTAMLRIPARAADLPTGVQPLVASLDAPPSADELRGFDHVFLLSPARQEQVELEITFLDALVAAGHRPHVVKVAADGFQDPDCGVRFMRNHREIALHLEATGLPVTYLAANLYMENLLDSAEAIRTEGVLRAAAGDGRIGFVAASDVAKVAARALTVQGHQDRTYVLTGPSALGYADVAETISAVFAREVGYEDVPSAEVRDRLTASGVDAWNADGVLELYEWMRGGGCDSITADVSAVTGDHARPLTDWLGELRGAFVGHPADAPPPSL
jgi:NAD(P)H dehydrogenase (quinone)